MSSRYALEILSYSAHLGQRRCLTWRYSSFVTTNVQPHMFSNYTHDTSAKPPLLPTNTSPLWQSIMASCAVPANKTSWQTRQLSSFTMRWCGSAFLTTRSGTLSPSFEITMTRRKSCIVSNTNKYWNVSLSPIRRQASRLSAWSGSPPSPCTLAIGIYLDKIKENVWKDMEYRSIV